MGPRRQGRAARRLDSLRLPWIGGLVALALVLVAGCGDDNDVATTTATNTSVSPTPSSSEVRVELSDRTVRPGQTFSAAIVNESDVPVTYGAGYELERRARSGEFVDFPVRPQQIPDIGLVADPGETGPEVEVEVPRRAEPGTYRVLLDASVEGGRPSAEFRIRD